MSRDGAVVSAVGLMLVIGLSVGEIGVPPAADAAGPWGAQVVDAETGQPLAGVTVLARWYRRAHGHPAIGLGQTGLHSAEQVVTDTTGRFALNARLFAPPPFFPVEGPELGCSGLAMGAGGSGPDSTTSPATRRSSRCGRFPVGSSR